VQGWTEDQVRPRFSEQTFSNLQSRFHIHDSSDFWEQSGALQAIVQNIVMDTLRMASESMVVRYEDLCASPLQQFTRLFEFSELELTREVIDRIRHTTRPQGSYSPGKGGVVRDSEKMIDRWRSVPEKNIELLARGYFANDPRYYLEDWLSGQQAGYAPVA
jgi:sulfur transfer complex TusBCD TusB component (DsrH family)